MGQCPIRLNSCIVSNSAIADRVYEMILDCPEIVNTTKPGQFVNLYCRHKGRLLPRPISVCKLDKEQGRLHLVYAVLGEGTEEFSQYSSGESIEVMAPLGNGFPLDRQAEQSLIIGGGVGTPPMVELCRQLGGSKTIVVGFRDQPYLVDQLEKYGKVFVATDSGSSGFKGNVVELIEKEKLKGQIYACGPMPMLRGVQTYADRYDLSAFLSLEERMGCGFGACVGCVTKIKANNEAGFEYKKVCKDGPVFDAKEVALS